MIAITEKEVSVARVIRMAALVFSIGLLASCGGGGSGGGGGPAPGGGTPSTEDMDGSGPTVGTYTEFAATTTGAVSGLETIALQNGRVLAAVLEGSFNHETGTVTSGDLSGTLNAARTQIALDAGGLVTLTNLADAEFIRAFDGTVNGQNVFGVVGVPTLAVDIPASGAGSAIYNGDVRLSLNNSDGAYVLVGDATLTADWNNSQMATRVDGLSGDLNGLGAGTVSGVLVISNATLSGAGFDGGTITTQTGVFTSSDPSPTLVHAGGLFGANADEAGGVVFLEATDLDMRAVFAAE